MAVLAANVRRAAAENTLTLPFRIPPQEWFTLRQAGAVMGLAESTVEKLYDRGEFKGHRHNAGKGVREHKRILRASLVGYMIRTADYTDESFADQYIAALSYFPRETLLRISAQAQALAYQGAGSPASSAAEQRR